MRSLVSRKNTTRTLEHWKMAIELNQAAVIAYLDEVLDAFSE
jgi:hypothetical protein